MVIIALWGGLSEGLRQPPSLAPVLDKNPETGFSERWKFVFTKSCLLLKRIIAPDLSEVGRQLREIQISQCSHSKGPLLVHLSYFKPCKADDSLFLWSLECSQSTANAVKFWIPGWNLPPPIASSIHQSLTPFKNCLTGGRLRAMEYIHSFLDFGLNCQWKPHYWVNLLSLGICPLLPVHCSSSHPPKADWQTEGRFKADKESAASGKNHSPKEDFSSWTQSPWKAESRLKTGIVEVCW